MQRTLIIIFYTDISENPQNFSNFPGEKKTWIPTLKSRESGLNLVQNVCGHYEQERKTSIFLLDENAPASSRAFCIGPPRPPFNLEIVHEIMKPSQSYFFFKFHYARKILKQLKKIWKYILRFAKFGG